MKAEFRCYDCSEAITKQNESKEHIIHNSIGGRLKSKKLLCSDCNIKYSGNIDLEIEKQLGVFISALGIKRDRKKKAIEFLVTDKNGKEIYMGEKAIPLDKMIIDTDGTPRTYHFQPGQYEAKKAELELSLEKTNGNFVFEEVLEHHKERVFLKNDRSGAPGEIGFGGIPYLRAVAKMALNYYVDRGYPKRHVQELIAFVKGETEYIPVHFYAPANTEPHQLQTGEVSHVIHIRGSRQQRTLYAYVELLNLQSVLIPIDLEYDGEEIDDSYVYDLLSSRQIHKPVKLKLTRQHLRDIHFLEIRSEIFNRRLERLMEIIQAQHILAVEKKRNSGTL
jgi:hypothetical protein